MLSREPVRITDDQFQLAILRLRFRLLAQAFERVCAAYEDVNESWVNAWFAVIDEEIDKHPITPDLQELLCHLSQTSKLSASDPAPHTQTPTP